MSAKKNVRERGRTVDMPSWWLDLVRSRVAGMGKSLGDVGEMLAEKVKREEPWSHASVSRFLAGLHVTDDMAEAFVQLLKVPPAIFVARSESEAREILELQKRLRGRSAERRGAASAATATDTSEDRADSQTLPSAAGDSDELFTSTERERLASLEGDLRRLQELVARLDAERTRQTEPVEPAKDVHAFRSPRSRRAKTDDGGAAT
jgi:hypothetical protein